MCYRILQHPWLRHTACQSYAPALPVVTTKEFPDIAKYPLAKDGGRGGPVAPCLNESPVTSRWMTFVERRNISEPEIPRS